MDPDTRTKCVRCGGVVDPRGVSGNGTKYCEHTCAWPVYVVRRDGTLAWTNEALPGDREVRGCGVRIFFQVNPNEKVQPFTLEDGRAHHGTCTAFIEWKRLQRANARRHEPVPELGPAKLEDFL